ncbi:MAG: GatB/YqeY domain-containing protein [Bacteroidales bacterium]|nr:GatB/YqeY domain-containing protein [Bacteroidales bacterium]
MSLFDKISDDIKAAMLARDAVRRDTLRGIKKEFLEAKTAKDNVSGELSDADALKIISKMAKKGKDAAQIFKEQNREDLMNEELAQVAVMEEYLPKQMSDEELTASIKEIVAQVGAQGPKDMGKVMGVASKKLAGLAEGRAISDKVKSVLAQMA